MKKIITFVTCFLVLFSFKVNGQSLPNNIVAYWKLDEASGTSMNDEVSTNDGTAISCTVNQTGRLGKAVLFSVSSSHISLPDVTALQMGTSSFSICAWVYPTGFSSSWNGIIGGETGAFVFGTYGTSGGLSAAKNNVAGSGSSGLNLTLNSWNFVAIVFNSTATTNNLTFYVNSSSATLTFNYDYDAGASSNQIGCIAANSNTWQGSIDEVGIWSRVLNTTDISSLYNSGNGLPYSSFGGSVPTAPSGLTATVASCSQINLSWTVNSSNETGFYIYRNSTQIASVSAGATSYSNTDLTASTPYSYYVVAYNGADNSSNSNTASATTPACSTGSWQTNGNHIYFNTSGGRVGIGTANPTELLTVNGKILAKEVEVVSNITADYVFEPEYQLMPLMDLELYLKQNKHLPGIPSVEEFAKKGQNLGQMDNMLLLKIEELTIYLLKQDETYNKLIREQKDLKTRVEKLESK